MIDQKLGRSPKEFLHSIDGVIKHHALLKHPFYKQWSEGRLSQQALAEYAKQYYAHVRSFPTYVSGVHSHCEDQSARLLLLDNLNEEERGEENHPELWLRFAEGLGLSRTEVQSAKLLPTTVQSVNAVKQLTQSEDYREGVAALYAYESQVPEVARTKREGLNKYYGINDSRSVGFFTVHEEADLIHREAEREILSKNCRTPEAQERALRSAEQSAQALWHFLDGVFSEYVNAEVEKR